jgi:hypothetical protein
MVPIIRVDTHPIHVVALAEGLSRVREHAERLRRESRRYPIFIDIGGYHFVMDYRQPYDKFVARLEELIWAWTPEVERT